jgi:hypothetical protein
MTSVRPCTAILLLMAGLLLGLSSAADAASFRVPPGSAAAPWVHGGPVRTDEGAERGVSLEQATRIARSAYGGRVVAARPAQRGGESGYQIRIVLDDGRVMNVFVDRQGRIR